MRRLIEITAFLGLSAAVHAGVMAGLGNSLGGSEGQGSGGVDRITLQAAPESLAALADRWTTAPSVTDTPSAIAPPQMFEPPPLVRPETAALTLQTPIATQPPSLDAAPDASAPAPAPPRPVQVPQSTALAVPQIATGHAPAPASPDASPNRRPAPSMAMPDLTPAPRADTRDPVPPARSDLAAMTSPRPTLRPTPSPSGATAPAPTAASAPQPARVAQGAGGGATQGAASAPAPTPAISAAQRQSLIAGWGAQIMARIERARPRTRGVGQVTLTLQIAQSGQLTALSVSRSSGDPDLDNAALSAVQRAGRFPAAPEGLTDASYGFSLPIRFR